MAQKWSRTLRTPLKMQRKAQKRRRSQRSVVLRMRRERTEAVPLEVASEGSFPEKARLLARRR